MEEYNIWKMKIDILILIWNFKESRIAKTLLKQNNLTIYQKNTAKRLRSKLPNMRFESFIIWPAYLSTSPSFSMLHLFPQTCYANSFPCFSSL